MPGLVSTSVRSTCLCVGLYPCPKYGHKFWKFNFHTSGPLHDLDKRPGIPMPIGRRPRPNPDQRPPSLVLPTPVKYVQRTTPRMGQIEAEEFLYPLYLRGWRVECIRTKDRSKRILTPFLTTKFVLKDNDSARQAIRKLLKLEEREKHDASYEIFLNKTIELNLRLQTHSARVWPVGQQPNVSPHVTLRDIRLAVLFERIVEENEFLLDQSLHKKTRSNVLLWDTILAWFPYSDTESAILTSPKIKRYG